MARPAGIDERLYGRLASVPRGDFNDLVGQLRPNNHAIKSHRRAIIAMEGKKAIVSDILEPILHHDGLVLVAYITQWYPVFAQHRALGKIKVGIWGGGLDGWDLIKKKETPLYEYHLFLSDFAGEHLAYRYHKKTAGTSITPEIVEDAEIPTIQDGLI